ncbi:hypothetical protein GOV12_05165 [Candidatus Pacearchaeota archaeon]|nr:hypothetical protein [Candidatus Pacearchaeota archaeon]
MVTGNQSDRYLNYFIGGKDGVQNRFGEAIRKRLSSDEDSVLGFVSISGGEDREILDAISNGDYSGVTGPLVEKVADPLGIFIADCLGEIKLKHEQRYRLYDEIQRKRCAPFVPKFSNVSLRVLVNAYIMTEAMREL